MVMGKYGNGNGKGNTGEIDIEEKPTYRMGLCGGNGGGGVSSPSL